ncbi:glycosyltransferase family 39 protein [Aureispira anguillae]|uniref:Uncharacterized protein n=1 Tax=Aureispira anguillae TaxID=2864201 RepID=A0A915VKJ9_9BACT|nr:glycosyltransferase family 39 protein [Aureispira anguillae]BDS09732.1 hypothetical protein AsAng_0004370 [Aureispira anguillae]
MTKHRKKSRQKSSKRNKPTQNQPIAAIPTSPPSTPIATSTYKISWLFALLGAVLYLNTLGHQYAFDDFIVITGNDFTQQGFKGIYDLMTRDFFEGIYGEQGMDLTGGRYRPLSLVMFAIEYQFFGLNPFVGHFINVLLYALTGFMLFRVLNNWLDKIEGGTVIAFIATLLFVVHPIHTEVVANIKSRDEIVGLLLILATLQGIYLIVEKKQQAKLPLTLLAFFMAMLSKENAFTFIALIPLSLFVLQKISFPKAFQLSLPFFAIALVYLAVRTGMLYKELPAELVITENPDIMENPFVGADLATRLATIGVILLHYLLLLVYPHPMAADYSFNQIPWTSFADPVALLGWGLYFALGIYAAIKIWKRDIIALGILYYLAPLSLVCNLFFNIGAPMADRFLYVPSLGFCLIVGFLLVKIGNVYRLEQLKKNLPIAASLVLVTLLFSGKTIARNPDWYDNKTLFSKDRLASPQSAKMQYYYANSLIQEFLDQNNNNQALSPNQMALLDSAEAGFKRSYAINPKFHHTTYNLGLVNLHKKNAQEALKWFQYTLTLEPHHGISHEQLVRVYGEFLKQPDKAMEHLTIVLSTPEGQSHASNYQHLGILHAMKGDLKAAEPAFVKAAKMDPSIAKNCYNNLAGMFNNLAATAQSQGDQSAATAYSKKAQTYQQLAAQAQ